MLNQLITEETFQYTEKEFGWKEAIREAARPLVENGSVTEAYVERTIEVVEENGPFIHLGKGVAIPHARPEEGVSKTGMTLLNLKNPTNLLDDPDHAISTIIVLASEDSEKHLEALKTLTGILIDDETLNELKNATAYAEVVDVLNN